MTWCAAGDVIIFAEVFGVEKDTWLVNTILYNSYQKLILSKLTFNKENPRIGNPFWQVSPVSAFQPNRFIQIQVMARHSYAPRMGQMYAAMNCYYSMKWALTDFQNKQQNNSTYKNWDVGWCRDWFFFFQTCFSISKKNTKDKLNGKNKPGDVWSVFLLAKMFHHLLYWDRQHGTSILKMHTKWAPRPYDRYKWSYNPY